VATEEHRPANEGVPGADCPPPAGELPTGKAFVVQLRHDIGPTLEPFAGRVEHLASGRRLRFDSFAAFQAAVTRLLEETDRR
jgi:hypothetical protein